MSKKIESVKTLIEPWEYSVNAYNGYTEVNYYHLQDNRLHQGNRTIASETGLSDPNKLLFRINAGDDRDVRYRVQGTPDVVRLWADDDGREEATLDKGYFAGPESNRIRVDGHYCQTTNGLEYELHGPGMMEYIKEGETFRLTEDCSTVYTVKQEGDKLVVYKGDKIALVLEDGATYAWATDDAMAKKCLARRLKK